MMFQFNKMITLAISLLYIVIIENCASLPFEPPSKSQDDIVPFIIGISLMGFVTFVLLASLLVWICIRRHIKERKYILKEEKRPEYINLMALKYKEISALMAESKIEEQDKKEDIVVSKCDVQLLGRSSLQIPRHTRYRRASVPAALSILQEASPSLEASRKMSLSYNCELDNAYDTQRNSIMPMNNKPVSIAERHSKLDSICKPSDEKLIQYLYKDELMSTDEVSSKQGKIIFSLYYNLDAKILEVTMKKAEYLRGRHFKGKNRFYVKLRLRKPAMIQYISTNSLSGMPDQNKETCKPDHAVKGTFRTSIKTDFCTPKFEETFKFSNVTTSILKESILQFVIKEETSRFLEKNFTVGQVNFLLDEAQLIEKHEFIPEIVRDILPIGPVENKGKATISLFYNRSLAILSVCLLDIFPGSAPLIDLSVELCLRSIDTLISSNKFDWQDKVKSNLPVDFEMDNCYVNSFCLVVQFFVRLRNCPKTPYGRIVIGPIRFSDGSGLMHWDEMSIGETLVVKTHKIM